MPTMVNDFHHERLPDRARASPADALPQAVANEDHGRPARVILIGQKGAALLEANPQDREQLGRDLPAGHVLGLPLFTDRADGEPPRRHRQRAAPAAAVEEVGIGKRPAVAVLRGLVRLLVQGDQSVGFRVGQRLQQHAVHDGKDDRGRAGAERQRQQHDGGKSRLLPEGARGVPDVLQPIVQPARAARIATLLLHLLRAAEREHRLSSRLPGREASSHQIRDMLVEMKAQLPLELLFHAAPAPQALPPVHSTAPSAIPRMSPIASVNRCQPAASALSPARPFFVSR